MFVPKYATNQELTDTFKPLADWDLELKDVFIVDYGEKKSLKDLTKVQRSLGIRHDDCEFVLRKYDVNLCLNKELVSTQAGLQLIGESDFQLASTENRVSILVWRDETGFNAPFRFLVDPDIVLEKLLNLLKDAFDIPSSSQRRLRDLFNNKLYTKSDLEVSLKDIRDREYNGQKSLGERIKLEAGTVPKAGGFVCTAKLDIFDQTGEKVKLQEDFTYTLTDTVRDLLEKACVALKVEQEDYSLYTCNWADEPVKRLKDLSATAEDESLTEDCTLKLMHYTQGTSDEIRTYEIFYSASGFPGDMKKIGKIAINENQHVEELKNKIKELCTPEQGFETPFQNSHVIVRKLNKIEKPTKALPDGSKSIKRLKVNCTGLVFTVYDHDVQANDNDLRIFIRKRIGKGYANFEEVILHE